MSVVSVGRWLGAVGGRSRTHPHLHPQPASTDPQPTCDCGCQHYPSYFEDAESISGFCLAQVQGFGWFPGSRPVSIPKPWFEIMVMDQKPWNGPCCRLKNFAAGLPPPMTHMYPKRLFRCLSEYATPLSISQMQPLHTLSTPAFSDKTSESSLTYAYVCMVSVWMF